MNSDIMNQDLVYELEYMEELLTKSGFFDSEEILEILEDQFIDEDIDISQYSVSSNDFSNENFSKLENAFTNLASEKIVAIHNCGYDISEGVNDAFELYVHLHNNKFSVEGFCFYTFENIEEAIFESKLSLTFSKLANFIGVSFPEIYCDSISLDNIFILSPNNSLKHFKVPIWSIS